MGKVPAKREETPFWLAQKINTLEVVFPHTGPQDKHRILTMCLPFGMVHTVEHCNTWGTVFAALYTTAHGTPTLANLPEVLKQIQDEYGAAPALDLGMQLIGNFATVSSIILSNLKGEAVALAVRMRLRDVPQQDQEWEQPKIIAETYSSIGRDSLGARPQKPQFQGKINKENAKQQPEGNKKRWEKKQQTTKKERGESPRTETQQNRTYIPEYATRIKPLYELIHPDFSSKSWKIEHTHTLRELQADLLAAKHLHTRDNKTHLVIRVIAGAIGFTYVTFNEGETVPIGYKSHLYSASEQRFAPTEKILTAVQMAVIKERPLAQGKRIIVVSPIPALEAVTKASVPNAKALHPRWIQWATSLTVTDVDYIFNPKLQTQEFLQYEVEYPIPADTLPIDQYQVVMYTDGSAQPAIGTKHQYSAACAVVSGYMEGEKFCPQHSYTQTLGDCTAQLAELKALLMALEHTDPTQFTLIVCDSYYCVQFFNEYLHYCRLNGFRDSKGNTIKHRLLWGKVADLKEMLSKFHVVHTLGHQCVGIHVAGNTLADEAAKSAVAVATAAAVTCSSSKPDTEIMAAIKATVDGTPYPKGVPNKYQYFMRSMLNAEVKIPCVGAHDIPNKVVRPELIKAAHEGVASAHAGVAATISLLQALYWWPGLYKET
ncbi:hypothetical protein NDU88_005959 [Pleurodeles waltl]|uniref:RNase H type-1 domain-containing protein n=1 Tax=Pleurodeles waltl TaxID=8319 RepID=A0AAV7SN71_PLEWA|nr:hypothetical protein NDU88_005959 [Pleurodeles waltl]